MAFAVTQRMRTLRWPGVFAVCFLGLFAYSAAVYGLLRMLGMQQVFGALYRMFMYHEAHGLQYIALFCAVHALMVTAALRCAPKAALARPWLLSVATLLASSALASVLGGVLWKIHDMHHGYFPPAPRLWHDLWWGAETGLYLGWQVLAMSQPFGLICLPFFLLVTVKGARNMQRPPGG